MKVRGMTLVEVMITVAVSAIVLFGVITFWTMASKSWTVERLKSHMSQQIEVGMEKMKKEIRASTSDPDEMVFYGAPSTTNPPYEAISFSLPKYSDTTNRIIDRTGGSINWNTTVIYHVYTDSETDVTELRRTVFNDRADLTKSQREAQLSAVVAAGDGTSSCQGSETTDTETVFTNVVTLGFKGTSEFDGYNPSADGIKSNNVGFGSILLTPGTHNVKFQLVGQNDSSNGYGLGIDCISLTPSGSAREGEDYYSVATYDNGTLETPEDMFANPNGVWSGNYHLEFSSSVQDSYVTLPIYYDEWRETNFDDGDISWDYTVRDQTSGHDYIIRLEGNETTWEAPNQVDAEKSDDTVTRENQYIRVIISQDCLSCSGSAAMIKFSSNSSGPLKILSAYFGIRNGDTPNFDTSAMTPRPLTFDDPPVSTKVIPTDSTVQSNWFELGDASGNPIVDKNAKVDYLVSFHIEDNSANANCAKWDSSDADIVNSYVLTTGGAGHEIDNWTGVWVSAKEYKFEDFVKGTDNNYYVCILEHTSSEPNCPITGVEYASYWENICSEDIFAVEDIFVSYVANGPSTCISQIYDTTVDNDTYPDYQTLSSDSSIPENTSLTLEVRAGDNEDMSDATGWSTSPAGMDGKQYLQFRTTLTNTLFPYEVTPEVKSVYINWDPTESTTKKLVDVSGYFTMRSDYGIFKILVDDKELIRGINLSMKIEGKVLNSTYSTHLTAEVYPRNTGK